MPHSVVPSASIPPLPSSYLPLSSFPPSLHLASSCLGTLTYVHSFLLSTRCVLLSPPPLPPACYRWVKMGLTGFHLTSAPLLGFQLSARLPALTCPLVTALLCCTTFPTSTLATKTVTVAEGIATAKADQVWFCRNPFSLVKWAAVNICIAHEYEAALNHQNEAMFRQRLIYL